IRDDLVTGVQTVLFRSRVHRIMDLKTPGSGEVDKNLWSNIDQLNLRDEVKFVIGSREDYEWSCEKVRRFNLSTRCHAVLFSPIRSEERRVGKGDKFW